MMVNFVLLVFPASILANMGVYFSAELHKKSGNWEQEVHEVSFSGDDVRVVDSIEKDIFGLENDKLLNVVPQLGSFRYMNDLHRWTHISGWDKIIRTLRPIRNKGLNVSLMPMYTHEEVFTNTRTEPANIDVGISQRIQNTISTSWSKEEHTVCQSIDHDIKLFTFGGQISINYTSAWGENTKQSQNVAIGGNSSTEITLEPGQFVVSQFYVSRGNIKMLTEYEASLSGWLYFLFSGPYRRIGHSLVCEISDCMRRSGLSNVKVSREVIDIGFYIVSKVIVYHENGTKLMEVAA